MNERLHKATWFDLPADDPVDLMSFYEGLFNWKFLRMMEPAIEGYWLIQSGQELIGGLRATEDANRKKSGVEAPVVYFTVRELDLAVERARELGALVVKDRVNLGKDRGCYQWLRDRQNNLVALWAPE